MIGLGASSVLAAALATCPFFVANDWYTRPIDRSPIDPRSEQYIAAAIDAGDTGPFWATASPVEFINVARDDSSDRRVRQKVAYHRFDGEYPWNDAFRIEPLGDAHAIVIRERTCELFETYDTSYSGGELSAYSGARWNLRRPFEPLPPGTPSAMASGLSLFAGMIRWEEVARGRIDHALNFEAPAGSVAQWEFVRPASDTDGHPFKGTSLYRLPYGAHLRLHASFDISHFGPQSAAIARAMKTYGIYLADTGSSDNGLYNAVALDGSNPWNARDLAALHAIHLRDFDVLPLGEIRRVPGH